MKRSPHPHNDSGLATVEFAIVGSLLCVLVFAIISVGIFINAKMQAANQARLLARAAALACSPAEVANGVIVTKSATKPFTWAVPFIPYPGPAIESASYRCGG
jgi:Flp pilus assembly protein TadG